MKLPFSNKSRGARRPRALVLTVVGLAGFGALYAFSASRYVSRCTVPRLTCLEHRLAGCSIDGVYPIRVGRKNLDAQCDMTTDDGGWTLVANYFRGAKTKEQKTAPVPMDDRLPLIGATKLGDDEVGSSAHWGHANTALLSNMKFREVHFSCSTTAHERTMNFVLASDACAEYFRSGTGSCLAEPDKIKGFREGRRTLVGHTAKLPMTAELGWKDQGDYAMTTYPFFTPWKYHWSLGANGNRWECDDHDPPVSATRHQIWVR